MLRLLTVYFILSVNIILGIIVFALGFAPISASASTSYLCLHFSLNDFP